MRRNAKELNKILSLGYKAESGAYDDRRGEKYSKRIWLVLLVIVYFICAILFGTLSQH